MSYDTSQTAALPSSTYAIWSNNHEAVIVPKKPRNSNYTFVVAENTRPFQWDVQYSEQGYTIQVHNQPLYIVTQDTHVLIADEPHYFQIRHHTITSQDGSDEVYFEIYTADNHLFRYNGGDALASDSNTKVPNKVTAEKNATSSNSESSSLWVFQELSGDPPKPTPYGIYSKNSDYFKYSSNPELLPRFGLKDTRPDRWPRFWNAIQKLNDDANGSVIYKVIFFGRHGKAFHNLSKEQENLLAADGVLRLSGALVKYTEQTADGDLKWDDQLLQDGFIEVTKVQDMWKDENSIKDDKGNAVPGIGIPTISYTSPLTRCLVTNSVTFTTPLGADGGSEINTVVVEDCREIVYKDLSERRRSKTYIGLVFPKFTIEPDFAEADPYWTGDARESDESVERRVQAVLDRIFKSETEKTFPPFREKPFVSITTHHEFFGAIVSALGGCPDAFPLHTGGVVPIICQYTPSPGSLDDGYYNIQYVPDPSLFADANMTDVRVVALSHDRDTAASNQSPTTWLVKCIDAEKQVYNIQYFQAQQQGVRDPELYWNTTSTNRPSDVPVVLSKMRGWRLVPTSEVGVY